ncbi:MAG: DUF3048 domain-containing protein [Clostridia bacterium]|nr:DUF3048 domain-containing protein [Clostridia bacterium]
MNHRRLLCLLLILTAVLLCTACKDRNLPPEDTQPTIADTQSETEAETETDAPETETQPVETEAPVTEAPQTEAPETEAPEPAVDPTIIDDGKSALSVIPAAAGTYVNPLSGRVCEQAQAERRPAAIMLNNIGVALPQQNIAAADVLYECEVEGGLTRLMGVFNDWSKLVAIGSIRSSREYYIDFAANHDAIYVHAGGSDEAYVNLKGRGINNIDGVNGGAVTAYFYRDPVRRQTMSLEHTLVMDGAKLDEAIAFKKYRTTYAKDFANPLNFVGPEQILTLADGAKCESFTCAFGAHKTSFVYDAKSGKYLRWQNGNKHIDGVTGDQIGYENVVVLFCTYTRTNDEKNHILVSDTGSGTGYLMIGGKYVSIQWSKATGDSQVKLTYPGGRAVYLTPGKTNFEIVRASTSVTIDA